MKYFFIAVLLPVVMLVSCCKEPAKEDVILPEDPNKASTELRHLWKLVRGGDKIQRQEAQGKLLRHIKPDMRREHVEVWLSKPAREYEIEDLIAGKMKKCIVGTYYCRLPEFEGTELEGRHLMTVVYEQRGDAFHVVEMRGPHFPD